MNNHSFITNVMVHEREHQKDFEYNSYDRENKDYRHSQIYLAQISHDSFMNLKNRTQKRLLGSFGTYVAKAWDEQYYRAYGLGRQKVIELADEFNDANVGWEMKIEGSSPLDVNISFKNKDGETLKLNTK